MSDTVIKIEDLSKLYRLGEVGTGTLSHDLNRWWSTRVLGRDDPYAKVGQVNDRTQKAGKNDYVWALKDINLEVKQGEILGVIGKNGAGKSTLLKLLSRVTSPTTGSIKVKGRLASLLEVGTGFHPEMTGRENIYMNGTIMGMRKWEIDKKLDEIVDFAGVAKYLDTPAKRYSSGMTVRLGFAVSAFLQPEILVVDEVLAVGDAEFQKKAIGKMQDVSQGQGRTVLFVSHNMGSIKSLCNRGIVLTSGICSFEGTAKSAIEFYIDESNKSNGKGILDLKGMKMGSEDLFLNEVGVFDSNEKVRTTFLQSEEIIVRLGFSVIRELKGVRFNLSLKTIFSEVAFSTTSHKVTKDGLTVGDHTLELRIPAFLLNDTRYTLAFSIGIPGVEVIMKQKDLLFIDIEGQGVGGSNFKEVWPGVVCPKINWTLLR